MNVDAIQMDIEHSLLNLKPVACQKTITGNSSCTSSIYPLPDQSSLCDMMLPVLMYYHTSQLLMLQPLWQLCQRKTYLNSLITDLQCSCTGQTVTTLLQAMNLSQQSLAQRGCIVSCCTCKAQTGFAAMLVAAAPQQGF